MMTNNVLSLISILLFSTVAFANEKVLLSDDFDRKDNDDVANGWLTIEENTELKIKDKKVLFESNDSDFEPRLSHKFPIQKAGKFTLSFQFDWVRDVELNWGFFIQLGDSSKIPEEMEFDTDPGEGMAVNLVWGGGSTLELDKVAVLSHIKDKKLKELTVVNDPEVEDSVIEDLTITINVDMDKGTYDVHLGEKSFKGLSFDKKVPIDTIQFMAHQSETGNFKKTSIDSVKIVKK